MFVQITCFGLIDVFWKLPILTMMRVHVCSMLYTHWTPLVIIISHPTMSWSCKWYLLSRTKSIFRLKRLMIFSLSARLKLVSSRAFLSSRHAERVAPRGRHTRRMGDAGPSCRGGGRRGTDGWQVPWHLHPQWNGELDGFSGHPPTKRLRCFGERVSNQYLIN